MALCVEYLAMNKEQRLLLRWLEDFRNLIPEFEEGDIPKLQEK